MSNRWQGTAYLDDGRLLYVGRLASTSLHAHHAFQLLLTRGAGVSLRGVNERSATRCRRALIPPDVGHAIDDSCEAALLLYLEPESNIGRRLLQAAPRTLRLASEWSTAARALGIGESWQAPKDSREGQRLIDRLLIGTPGGDPQCRPLHPTIDRLLANLSPLVESGEKVRFAALARDVGLSESRVSHLFSANVGVTFRAYVLWLRLKRGAEAIRKGSTLTEAAHAAGFADSAHLARTFRRMFGLAPSEISTAVRWIVDR